MKKRRRNGKCTVVTCIMQIKITFLSEDGQIINLLPGTLKRYHEESDINYNQINPCLCTTEDHNHMLAKDLDTDSENEFAPLKCFKPDTNSASEVNNHIKFDKEPARQLESDIE